MFYFCLVYSFLTLIVYPLLIIVIIVASLLILLIVKFAMRTSVEALRHDAISRSPINSLFSATLENLMTIRAYDQEDTLNKQF